MAGNSTNEDGEKHWYFAAAKFTEPVFRPYVLTIGQAALAWNSLQEALGGVFWALMGGHRGTGQPMAVWQSLKSDRAKRDMLGAAYKGFAKEFDERFPNARADLDWLIKETSGLEDKRNNAVHAPLSLSAPFESLRALKAKGNRKIPPEAKVVPQDWSANTRAQRIAGRHILTEYRWCRAAAITLRDFAAAITEALRNSEAPWPDRPQMPNRGQTKTK